MMMKSSTSPSSLSSPYMTSSGKKRARLTTPADESTRIATGSSPPSALPSLNPAAASSFRNVSACNRCRLRKNRCDQNLPACSSCEKAGVKCVGFDPITKREIPRTYVFYLESRVMYLESLLTQNRIQYAPSQEFDRGAKPLLEQSAGSGSTADPTAATEHSVTSHGGPARGQSSDPSRGEWEQKQDEAEKLNKLVSNIGMVSVQGASDPRYLGSTSGISFARIVFAAVKSSVSGASAEKGGFRAGRSESTAPAAINESSMRDSFFGLHTKPNIKEAPFPNKKLGLRLVNLYFEYANPQIPVLHRGDFMLLFDRAYASKDRRRSPRELYMLNIVFAIGAGIILDDLGESRSPDSSGSVGPPRHDPGPEGLKKQQPRQMQPEEYHASAMMHLESCLGSGPSSDRSGGLGSGLEELQAVLLLAGFALLRPVAPGLWYIVGVAVRLGVDLGLHCEDGFGGEGSGDIGGLVKSEDVAIGATGTGGYLSNATNMVDEKEQGRRDWIRDLRRRLWWCVYSFDRLVSTCVGRPFGITDQVITTKFPSVLDDADITSTGFKIPPDAFNGPSYKRVAHHYFRLRLLQSEILQVLQYRQAQMVHASNRTRSSNQFMHTTLPSPFLQNFTSFHSWRRDIDRRLWDWKESAPLQQDITVKFPLEFLELNYWQAVIMLYRQSLSVPPLLVGEVSPSDDVASPMILDTDDHEGEDEIFLKVAEAGQKVLRLYRQLHRVHLVNYTYLATVHLFMAGIAFLYAIWHSTAVRNRLTLDDVDFTVLAATSVLDDLIEKCPPAEACRDAFDRMSKATVKMCLATTGFGSRPTQSPQPPSSAPSPTPQYDTSDFSPQQHFGGTSRPPPQFDMNLRDLFPEQEQDDGAFGRNPGRCWPGPPRSTYAPPRSTPLTGVPPSPCSASPHLPPSVDFSTPPHLHAPAPAPAPLRQPQPTYDIYGFPNSHEFDFLMIAEGSGGESMGYYGDSTGLGGGSEEGRSWGEQRDLFDGFFFGSGGVG